MAQQKSSRSVMATLEGIKRLKQAKAEGRIDEGTPLTYERIAEDAKLNPKTVSRFFNRKKVDSDSALMIIKVLGLQKEDVLASEDIWVAETISKIQNDGTDDSGRAAQLIGELEAILREFKQDEEHCLEAMEWLKAHRKELARDAAEAVLSQHNLDGFETVTASESDIKQFADDIRQYLKLIYHCLDVGTWELMDEALQKQLVPVNLEASLYKKALIFILEEKVKALSSSDISKPVEIYLNYLINIIGIRL